MRALTEEFGSLLIFDEVKTGLPVRPRRRRRVFRGARRTSATYAKAMGNGYPVAAIAMTDKVADGWRSSGIAQAGTYSGNGIGGGRRRGDHRQARHR